MAEPSDWLAGAAETLAGVTDRWVTAGALAAIVYRSTPRLTTDADLLVTWDGRLLEALEAAGYELRVIAEPGEHPHLLIHRGDRGRIDFIVATVDYQELAIDRGRERHVLTAEDVIVHKLIAWRPKDQGDVTSILAAGHVLDVGYIERWAAEWGVADRWRSALGDG